MFVIYKTRSVVARDHRVRIFLRKDDLATLGLPALPVGQVAVHL